MFVIVPDKDKTLASIIIQMFNNVRSFNLISSIKLDTYVHKKKKQNNGRHPISNLLFICTSPRNIKQYTAFSHVL